MNLKKQSIRINTSKNIKEDWKFITAIIPSSLMLHTALWIGWPLHPGADSLSYIYYFVDFFNKNPVYHNLICYRTPVAPFFYGILLSSGGMILTSVILEILSLSSVLLIYMILSVWGKWPARVGTIIYILMLPFQIQFHQVGCDGLFAFFIILFCFFLLKSINNNNIANWIWLGIIIAIATLIRPAGIVMSLAIIVILFLKLNWKKKIIYTLVFLISISFLLVPYVLYKGNRYDDYSIARGFNNTTFYRIFRLSDNPIKPENGPYTRKLIETIKNNILNTDIYRNYNVNLDDFLEYKPNSRFTSDIIAITDIKEGWVSNYKLLTHVSLEYIKSNPSEFLKLYTRDFIYLMTANPDMPDIPTKNESYIINKNDNNLQEVTEGEMIPYPNIWWPATRPDGTLPTPEEENLLNQKCRLLADKFFKTQGNKTIGKIFNYIWESINISTFYLWILGFIGIFLSKNKQRLYLITMVYIFFIYIGGTLQGTIPWLRYRLPLDPILLILGISGLSLLINKLYNRKTK